MLAVDSGKLEVVQEFINLGATLDKEQNETKV